ncbi:MAG: SCO family protein [Taibaiella sp.]|nr:SCO family protein [Taibaiella sp.]
MNSKKTGVFLIAFFILLGISFLSYWFKINNSPKPSLLPVIGNDQNHHVQPFSFVNQEGKTITEKDIKGKVCVVSYFFATCKSICPKMSENMTQVYKAYRGNKDVLILSHTVDPKRDTVQALKAYSLRFDADPTQWMFLTGDKKQLYDMARYSYLINAEDTANGVTIEDDFIHDQHYVLIDKFGRIRGFYDGLELEQIKKIIVDIKDLLKE